MSCRPMRSRLYSWIASSFMAARLDMPTTPRTMAMRTTNSKPPSSFAQTDKRIEISYLCLGQDFVVYDEAWVSEQAIGIQHDDQARCDAADASRIETRELPGRRVSEIGHTQRTHGWTTRGQQADISAPMRNQDDAR